MSFNFLEIANESRITINDDFQDFVSLDKYTYVYIRYWNREYPLPTLPNNIIVLEISCNYEFSLNNLPSSIKVIILPSTYKYPLANLPINLYQLEFNSLYNSTASTAIEKHMYVNLIHFLPESVKILKIEDSINQSSYNLPIELKHLNFSSDTFLDEVVNYPHTLEIAHISNKKKNITSVESDKLNNYFNLINLPLSLKSLQLPGCKILNLENILERLINLEELYIPYNFHNSIIKYPPNLVNLHIEDVYEYDLVNLPASLKYLSLGWYNESLEAVKTSNIEHINLIDNKDISIIHFIPKSLKKITIIETHSELYRIREQYPHLEIIKLTDYDYQEELIDSMRSKMWY